MVSGVHVLLSAHVNTLSTSVAEGRAVKIKMDLRIGQLHEPPCSDMAMELRDAINRCGLTIAPGLSGIEVTGDIASVFRCLRDSFEQLANRRDVVLMCKIFNSSASSAIEEEKSTVDNVRQSLNEHEKKAKGESTRGLLPKSRELIALAAAIAHQRELHVVALCVRRALAVGATPENVLQVVCQATQMAELPIDDYEAAARRGIQAFEADGRKPS